MARITLSVDGTAEFDRLFARYDAVFEDLTDIWPAVREKFWEIEKEQFASEGGAGRSGRWKPLSERYKARKLKLYGNKPILQATGDLYGSLTGPGPHTVYRPGRKDLAIGSNLRYAIYHYRGGPRLPKREPISLGPVQREEMTKTIQLELVKQLRKGRGYVAPGDR